jgi:hypothetical protein
MFTVFIVFIRLSSFNLVYHEPGNDRQAQDQLLLGNRKGPGHGAPAIAVVDPAHGIGSITALEALYLALAQLQQKEASRTLSLPPAAFSMTFTR